MSVKTVTKAFREYCKVEALRITPPREYVLEIIAGSSRPLTAYEVLESLGRKLDNPKPPTAYRALEFLVEHHFIHRIESLNAYVSCAEDHKHSGSQFMICDHCGHVEEVHMCHIPDGLKKQASQQSFALSHWNVELHGICKNCL